MTIKMRRKFFPDSPYARAFLILTMLEALTDITLEAAIIFKTDLVEGLFTSQRTPLAVYLGIFILAHVFQLYFAWDALAVRNTIMVIGLCGFNAAFLIYAILQVSEIRQIQDEANLPALQLLLLIIPIVIGTSQVLFMYLSWHIFREFGWQIYKQIGADRRVKRMFLFYQIFICLLKFDWFFFLSFCIQLILLVESVSTAERYLTIVAVPIAMLFLIAGYYAVRREKVWLMGGFLVGMVAGGGYFVYKLFRIWQGRFDEKSYGNVFKSLTVFSVICLLMILLTAVVAGICWRNFDHGLKSAMDKRVGSRKEEEATDGLGMHYNLTSAQNSRMSID